MPSEGWMCPNCGSAHAPSVLTCPTAYQTSVLNWPSQDTGKCPGCGKKRGLSIPRMGIYEVDRCMCPIATTITTSSDAKDVPQRGEKAICVEFVPDADGEYQVDSCVYCGHPRREHSRQAAAKLVKPTQSDVEGK